MATLRSIKKTGQTLTNVFIRKLSSGFQMPVVVLAPLNTVASVTIVASVYKQFELFLGAVFKKDH